MRLRRHCVLDHSGLVIAGLEGDYRWEPGGCQGIDTQWERQAGGRFRGEARGETGSMADIERLNHDHPDWKRALRLVLGGEAQPIARVDRAVASLLEVADVQGLRIEPVLAAMRCGRLVGACVAVVSPGRSALTFLGPSDDDRIQPAVGVGLLAALCDDAWRRDVALLQTLLPPDSNRTAKIYREAGFRYLTELVYLDRSLSAPKPPVKAPKDLSYLTYSRNLEPQFLAVLERTYVESLDCPKLTGLRATRDVLLGHRHTGVSKPEELWFLALCNGRPSGVLLLSGVHHRSCLEVVYMGVVAEARGRRLGDALISWAVDVGRRRGVKSLTLAVDRTNTHACDLYDRWGFEEVARRRAWICRRPF